MGPVEPGGGDSVPAFLPDRRGSAPDEDGLIVPLALTRRALDLLRAPTDRDPRWDLQLANVRVYAALG
jgi:hypothetical protein